MIGAVLPDHTVKGGTGWGAEFAKLCNKPLFVFDQDRDRWFAWKGESWVPCPAGEPVIRHTHFTGTGTRHLADNGKAAIAALFERSFPGSRMAATPESDLQRPQPDGRGGPVPGDRRHRLHAQQARSLRRRHRVVTVGDLVAGRGRRRSAGGWRPGSGGAASAQLRRG